MKLLRNGVLALLVLSSIFFASCSTSTGSGRTVTRTEVTGKIGKYATPYEVGDIVFNDGSATPYTDGMTLTDEQKSAAIALIFYKGTGLNSGDDTTTSRTLGVGLKHDRSGRRAWCLLSANACSKNITTIQCTPVAVDTGELTFTGDRNGSDNLEQIAAFLSATDSGTTDDTSTAANYPAFYFAKNYKDTANNLGTTYADGWYLPSYAELFQIYANGKGTNKKFDIDSASEALGGDKFQTSVYWSSSQYDSEDEYAWLLNFSEGGLHLSFKANDFDFGYECAIRVFN